jgi:NADH-quinone oxidoreductase subunit N
MTTDLSFTFARTLVVLLPEILLILAALGLITASAFVRAPRQVWGGAALATLLAALVALVAVRSYGTDPIAYGSVALNDDLAFYARLGFLLTAVLLLALGYDQVADDRAAEFFGSLLLLTAGANLVASSNELVFLFLGLELVSIPTYLLLYLPRRGPGSHEALTKYFYLSVLSSGLLLFGLAYLYGLTGISNLKALGHFLHAMPSGAAGSPPLVFGLIASLFIMAGLGFRVAAVPFHFYAPDVYQGAPTVIAALLAWVPKGVGFLAMLRLLTATIGGTGPLAEKAVLLTGILAVATMVLGNTVALVQYDLKRLLAYSSIAHAGYLLIGIAVAYADAASAAAGSSYLGGQGVVFYLASYALMTLGVFGLILWLSSPRRPVETIDDLAGLGRTQPLAALAMTVCLLSLLGFPFTAGFWGKFTVFASAFSLQADPATASSFRLLAVIGVLNAAIGAYYYLRIIVLMFLADPHGAPVQPRSSWPTQAAVAACVVLTLVIGLMPSPVNRAARAAAVAAFSRPSTTAPAPIVLAHRP